VILSGGSGTRLWPLSTGRRPKQFAALLGESSLFRATLDRVADLPGVVAPTVVAGAAHLPLIEEEFRQAGAEPGAVIIEPEGRNTAPAIAAAALHADPDDVLVILPADHIIGDVATFRERVMEAADLAGQGSIVTFGVVPTRPETGYGYLETGGESGTALDLVGFLEKPDQEKVRELVADDRFLWNSGMFVATAGSIISEMERFCPELIDSVRGALPDVGAVMALGDDFLDATSISFDHAVMEKTGIGMVIPLDVGWSDIGSYLALMSVATAGEHGNVTRGAVTLEDVTDSLVIAETRPVAVLGLSGIAVIDTEDGVLVIPLDRSQEVRDLAERVSDG
jgi:mannose-1-phosphate guanylyltransferase / mannose-6-phosphate isomerase